MKTLILAAALVITGAAVAQDSQEIRDRAEALRLRVYQLPEVRQRCTRTPKKVIEVVVDEMPYPVDCPIWRRWYDEEQRKKEADGNDP